MLEAKGKDLALMALREQLAARGVELPGTGANGVGSPDRAVTSARR